LRRSNLVGVRRLALVVLAALAATASADDDTEQKPSYRAVVDRVELEPASITGMRLRIYLSALAIDGQMLDLTDPKAIRVYLGGGQLNAPYALGSFSSTSTDTAIVVLVQATQDYSEALTEITEALDHELIEKLGEHAQIAIIPYGENAGTAKLAPAKGLTTDKTVAIHSDGSVGDPALMDAVDRALILLRKADTPAEGQAPHPLRKIVVVIGDGRDRGGDHDRVTAAGKRAAKEGVRIHAIAYSPGDVRRPLLVLGELAKQSMGTFRWPGRGRKPTADSWSDTFKQLEQEIDKQYVLTYFVGPEDEVAAKRLHVVTVGRTETTSNEMKVPDAATCGGSACEGYCSDARCVIPREAGANKLLMWSLYIGGGVVGGILLLGTIGYFVQKKNRPAPLPGEPGGPILPPNMLANGQWAPTLLVMTGPLAGKRMYLRNGFLIGKQPGCDLQIDDQYASSQHCQIGMDPVGNCKLYDRGSTNGTLLNGVPVQEAVLQHGMTIRIGSCEMRFLTQ
jgi:hypothetical protein